MLSTFTPTGLPLRVYLAGPTTTLNAALRIWSSVGRHVLVLLGLPSRASWSVSQSFPTFSCPGDLLGFAAAGFAGAGGGGFAAAGAGLPGAPAASEDAPGLPVLPPRTLLKAPFTTLPAPWSTPAVTAPGAAPNATSLPKSPQSHKCSPWAT